MYRDIKLVIEELKFAGYELQASVGMPDWFDKSPQAQFQLGIAHMKLAEFVGVISGIGLPCEVSEHYESGSTWCHTHNSFDEEFCNIPNKCGRKVSTTEPYVETYVYTDEYYPKS